MLNTMLLNGRPVSKEAEPTGSCNYDGYEDGRREGGCKVPVFCDDCCIVAVNLVLNKPVTLLPP